MLRPPWATILLFGLWPALPLRSAEPAPEFTSESFRAVDGAVYNPMEPGRIMSVYGGHLGSPAGCVGSAEGGTYPKELCNTQVFVAGKPAGLLYVSERQINFMVPQDSLIEGTVDVRIVYRELSSAPIPVKVGLEPVTVSLDEPAYTGMPLWLRVKMAVVQYPQGLGPAGFGCNEVQVRRDGKLLPLLDGSDWTKHGGDFSGLVCGSYAPGTRLPLHLLYRFDKPGFYEVRYALKSTLIPSSVSIISEWTPIEVLASAPGQRSRWLETVRRRAPMDRTELLTDTLPGLLGMSDEASLQILIGYLYHPDGAVRLYAMNGLSYWPEASTSQRLLALLKTRGPSDELVVYLLRQPAFRAAHVAEIMEASVRFLSSDSPVLLAGAVMAMRQQMVPTPAVLEAGLRSAEHVLQRGTTQNVIDFLQVLTMSKDERVHALVRRFVEQGHHAGAPILASFHNPQDVPLLTSLMRQP